MSRFDVSQIVSMYNSGMIPRAIAEAIGCSVSNVRYILERSGTEMRRQEKIDWPIEDMRKWYEVDGMTVEEIGKRLGRSGKVVNKVCKKHGFRMRPRGQKFGPEHKGWKGGRIVDKGGYILVYAKDHPRASSSGYVREHRLVMEKKLGRFLLPGEVVHHIDGVTHNNHPDNLELFQTNGKHLAETRAGMMPNWSEEGRERLIEACRKGGRQSSIRRSTRRNAEALP